jgi:ADP-dependent phosphofructokinase/glucokinase
MIKDDYLSILDNDFDLKINSVKIEHFFNKIFISNYNSIRQDLVFNQKDGFPMKLSVNSFLVILIECKHKAIQEFKIPIESAIEWKIVNGIKDGAFKHGFGVNTKYSDKDSDTSVIYYPPKEGIGKGKNQTKEISILIKIKSLSDKKINNDVLSNNSNDINSIRLNDFDVHQYLLTLYLNQKQGFLNKMLYEVSLTVKKIGIENELDNFSNLHTYKIRAQFQFKL